MGRTMLLLGNAAILLFEFQNFSNTVSNYGSEVKKLAETSRIKTEKQNQHNTEKRSEADADPRKVSLPPKVHEPVPFLNFAPVENALVKIEKSAQAYGQAQQANSSLSASQKKELGQLLFQS